MQIERLVRMIFYIVNRKQVTAKELADYFGVSTLDFEQNSGRGYI